MVAYISSRRLLTAVPTHRAAIRPTSGHTTPNSVVRTSNPPVTSESSILWAETTIAGPAIDENRKIQNKNTVGIKLKLDLFQK